MTLSDSQYDELRQRAEESDMDMSEFVRNALRVYNFLQKERKRGNQVYIGKEKVLDREIVLP